MNGAVGLIGAGLLGGALGTRLMHAGRRILVYDLDPRRARKLGAESAPCAEDVAKVCRKILLCLPTSADVRRVVLDLPLRRGQVVVDATTGDPGHAEALGKRLAKEGVDYLELPMAASSAQVRRGEALALAAGPRRVVARCRDLLGAVARRTFYAGSWGEASRLKLVHNLVLGLNRAALAEGLAFARSLGLAPRRVLSMLGLSAAASRVMERKGPKMVRGDFAPEARLAQHLKDVRIILAEAGRAGLTLPLTLAHRRLLERAVASGFGELDNSAIVKVYDDA